METTRRSSSSSSSSSHEEVETKPAKVKLTFRAVETDSGMGSSNEQREMRNSANVKSEVERFQREIERRAEETNRHKEWILSRRRNRQQRQSLPAAISMDSLRVYDEAEEDMRTTTEAESSTSPIPPPLPPKTKFVSCEQLSSLKPEPKFPPKRKKKVSISTREAEVFGGSDDSTMASMSTQTLVPIESMSCGTAAESDDSLATLPSVKELASKFTSQSILTSPEPRPRKSLIKVRSKFDSIQISLS